MSIEWPDGDETQRALDDLAACAATVRWEILPTIGEPPEFDFPDWSPSA